MGILIFSFLAILVICGAAIGWAGNEMYKDYTNKRAYDGLYFKSNGWANAVDRAKAIESDGDWVCTNVRGMDYPRAYETCVHECSHAAYSEIFAEQCEDDFEKCWELIQK